MGRKDEYKLQNEQYLEALRAEEDIKELPCRHLLPCDWKAGNGVILPV